MAYTAALMLAATPIRFDKLYGIKVRSDATKSSLNCSASSFSSTETATEQNIQKFSYSRASPTVRWPHLKLTENDTAPQTQSTNTLTPSMEAVQAVDGVEKSLPLDYLGLGEESQTFDSADSTDEALEVLGKPSRTRAKKMTKLALKRAKDWRQRVQFLTDEILRLQPEEFVADVLDKRSVQMTPTDFCFLVKWVGQSNWHRALEVYEWLNLQHWYSPNARMLATILAVLGKANQEALAVEIFTRAEPAMGNTVQVYNAMMGVYARNGRFSKVQELLDLMRDRGCEPDLVSFNTLINARAKSGSMPSGSTIELLNEVRRSGLRPDVITYNTLISACSRGSTLEEALEIYEDMESHKCQPDIWTYNAMISVYGQCGMAMEAERLYKELGSKGFFPDVVTYNALLYAFAREGNVVKVKEICEEMVEAGFGRDEMTYNTIIHMYGKQGQHDLALQTYRDMKSLGCNPDAVTYTVLINSLGKADKITEAAKVMSEMLAAGVKPTLRTFSALICGYAKAGMRVEAEATFHCMLRSGIKPDHLAYSVMLDIFLRSNDTRKAMGLYQEMVHYDFRPEDDLYQAMLSLLMKEKREEDVERVMKDMELCGMSPEIICSHLVKGECYDDAAKMLKLAATQGHEPDSENLLSILSSYSSSGRHTEAHALLDFLREHASGSHNSLTEARIILFCKDHKLDAAMEEYRKTKEIGVFNWSCTVYGSLIHCCEEAGLLAECSQLYSDMKFCGVEPSHKIFRSLVTIYCKLGFPETAHYLVDLAESLGFFFDDFSVYVDLIEVYGKLKLLQRAESLVEQLRLHHSMVNRKVWNALIHAYAANGCYEQARAVFNIMIRDCPSPTVDSINGLLQALIIDGRLDELYVVIQELQDMDFKISKSSILLMLDAFARAGNIFEVKKIYHGMKAAGYFPTMHLYRSMIGLFSRGKRVRDIESLVSEMEEAGFKPDLQIFNSLLKLYTTIEDFRKTAEVYQQMQASGLKPDADTYNTLILMYCRDRRPEEGLSLLHEMKKHGMDPKLDTFKSLISACGKQQLWEQAEELFEWLRLKGLKLDRSFYHIMMKIYRNSGSHSKAENVLVMMKEAGLEPTIATMHLLMVSYGSAGQPMEAEKVLNNLKTSGLNLSTLPYSSVIDAYLKNREYDLGIEKLLEMRKDGMEPDHRIWTCFIRAASLSQITSEAMILLNSLRDTGFDLPIRLLTEKAESLVAEVDHFLEQLVPVEDNAAFNFVNALEDLLWALERRATASWLFQLAIKRHVYHHDIFRVSEKDWGADFRKLSPGAALVGLTLWLDHMQDASLQGSPESSKSVVLITGTAEYNMVSLNKTLKAYLWEMGSPFLPCKTRTGLLVAKGHSLRMWLKDSPFCLDLELKDAPSLPESNSMQLSEGCFMRSCLIPVFNEIHERLGKVRPKKFARLALLSDEKRDKVIRADLQGRKEKLEKLKKRGGFVRPSKKMRFGKRKFIRKVVHPDHNSVILDEQVLR
ncbi:pentatricopeptide repeat-containing protein At3g18110, chloroplastic [Telopea speciosissima]|uniref:pentatricopeptide repeat-containing protein At3g18110, chloroplastic n=1 Tax=Telopea speciosissima TaxID=54955 RepID=UPI001CC54A02|nr:pentatricopeptide repeat-containing protein At3g18110, chloroplastic [Telopea speciosissima]